MILYFAAAEMVKEPEWVADEKLGVLYTYHTMTKNEIKKVTKFVEEARDINKRKKQKEDV